MKVKIFVKATDNGDDLSQEINTWLSTNPNIEIVEKDIRACAAEKSPKEHHNHTRVVVAI